MTTRWLSRSLLALLFLETGVVLLIAPWSVYWERNFFVESLPWVGVIFGNNFFRGAVSGLGIVNIGAGLADLASLFVRRAAARALEQSATVDASNGDEAPTVSPSEPGFHQRPAGQIVAGPRSTETALGDP